MPKPYRQLKNDLNKRARQADPNAHLIGLRELNSVWNYYNGICAKCGESNPDLVTFDHVQPIELGGTNTVDNYQLLCEVDNKGKGATFADYRPKDKPILKHTPKRVSDTYRGGRCKGRTKTGKPCGGYAIEGSRYCFTHEPSRAKERAKARRRGGENHPHTTFDKPFPAQVDVKTAGGLLSFVECVMQDTWTIETSIARGRTLGYLAQVQKGILEVGQLEDRVKKLEELAQHGQLGKAN